MEKLKAKQALFMKRWVLFIVCLFPAWSQAASYGTARVAAVVSVYDGDTFRANIAGWPALIGNNMPIRVKGVDAPEIRGQCESEKAAAREARQFTVDRLNNAQVIELRNMERGKYFRILADVYLDGVNLTGLLLNAGHARPYQGGKRAGWCSDVKEAR